MNLHLDVATPTSPIDPERESGEINKKGIAVVIVFNLSEPVKELPSISAPVPD